MFLPTKSSIREIFKETKDISIDDFETRIRQLHHQYIKYRLVEEFTEIDDVFRFEEEAEYLIGICTHPYRIDKIPGQLLRDGLSIAATIFEFLGDIAEKYDDKLEPSYIYYLKSALCYSLAGFESRTTIIAKRLLDHFKKPEQNIDNRSLAQYTFWFISLFLIQGKSLIFNRLFYGKYTAAFNEYIKGAGDTLKSVDIAGDKAIFVNLSLACLAASQGLEQGKLELINDACNSLVAAKKLATYIGAFQLYFIADSLLDIIRLTWSNSPWVRLLGVINRKKYIEILVRDVCKSFWTSQIAALEMKSKIGELKGGYLDERIRRVVINMPTSAGKSLIAEMAMAKTLFDYRSSTCIYVTPTKALVEQVTNDLSKRFRYFGIRVGTTSNDNEVADFESSIIENTRILVLTQEKLNYLLRGDAQLLETCRLFIFDEVHNISLGSRGWTYEETISLLLQGSTSTAKMIFMSAIMPNHFAIKEWVDPMERNDTIAVSWQPTRQLKGIVGQPIDWKSLKDNGYLQCYANIYFARNRHDSVFPIRIDNVVESKYFTYDKKSNSYSLINKDWQTKFIFDLAQKFKVFGQVMIYFPTNTSAHDFCKSYVKLLNEDISYNQELVESLLDNQVPQGHPLLEFVKKRVAYHDSSLSLEARGEIEKSFKNGLIQILATSKTLLQGVNIPAKTFIVSDYGIRRYKKKERWETLVQHPIDKKDFKNLLGRVGRAGYDTEGQIIFCQHDGEDNWRQYLFTGDDDPDLEITSALSEKNIQDSLVALCSAIEEGILAPESVIDAEIINSYSKNKENLLRRLQTYALIKNTSITLSHEDSIEALIENSIKDFTLVGQSELASYNVAKFISYSAKAIRSKVPIDIQYAFKKTGLSYQSAYQLYIDVLSFWSDDVKLKIVELDDELVQQIGGLIYSLEEIKPNVSFKAMRHMSSVLSEWIFKSHTSPYDNMDFIAFFNKCVVPPSADVQRKAELFNDFRTDTLIYKSPWGLSAFYIISEHILRSRGVDIKSLPLNDSLVCLPNFAKYGVYKPAAALFCSIGLKSPFAATKLSLLYESIFGLTRVDFTHILDWFLNIQDRNGNEVSLEELEKVYGFSVKEVKNIRDAQKELEVLDVHFNSEGPENQIVIAEGVYLTGWKSVGSQKILDIVNEGDLCDLEQDKNNIYDVDTVKVILRNVIIGYLPTLYTRYVLDNIENGNKVIVRVIEKNLSNGEYRIIKVKITSMPYA